MNTSELEKFLHVAFVLAMMLEGKIYEYLI